MNIKVKCACGQEIDVNPASLLAKMKPKPSSEEMSRIAKLPRRKRLKDNK